ncbi:MAG: TolC family protein [Myxococcota bacterium]|nr:TolC family protein [Myxococcota bacterium]
MAVSKLLASRVATTALWPALLCVFVYPGTSLADRPLSLSDAVRTALANHEDAEIALLRLKQAEARERQSLARLFPQLDARASVVYLPETTSQVGDLGVIESESTTYTTGSADLTVDLVNLGALVDYMSAPDRTKAQHFATQETRRKLAFGVARQFLTVLATEQVRVAAQNRLDVAALTVTQAQQRFEAGVGRASDVTRAELEKASAQSAQIGSDRDALLEGLNLMQLLAVPKKSAGVGDLQPPGSSLIDFDWRAEALSGDALDSRLDLKRARLLADVASESIRENLAGFLPTLSAGATVSKSDDGVVERDFQWSVGLNLRWSIYAGGSRWAEDDYRTAETRATDLWVSKLTRSIGHDVQVAQQRLEASLQEVQQAKVQAELAEKNGKQTAAMFEHGLATALERVDAIANTFSAQANLVGRTLETRLAELALLEALGRWPTGGTAP